MAYNLGFAHGRITLTYNGGPAAAQLRADLARMQAAALSAHNTINNFGKRLDKMSSGLVTAAKYAGKGALAVTGLHHALILAAGAAAQIAPVVGAGLALIPGAILAGVVAMGVFKIATKGVGDALKAAGGDSKTFEEAIKNLSPEAQKFARSWRAAGESLKPVQKAMQDAFFNKTGPEIAKISKSALGLKKEAVGVADGFNQVFRRVLEFLSTGPAIIAVRSTLQGVRQFLINMDGAIKPLLTGFASLAAQAGKFGGALGDAVATGMITFGEFLQGIDLDEVLSKAMDVLRPLGTLLKDVGSILASVFGGLQAEGTGTLGVLGELVSQLALFLKTAEGQEAIAALGAAMNAIAGATGQVFMTLLKELAPVIVALAPAVGELATQVAGVLVPALEILGPILTGIAKFMSGNMDVIGPLIIGIYALAGAMKVYNGVAAIAKTVSDALTSSQVRAAIAWIRSTAATVASSVATAYHTVVARVAAAATRVWTAIQWLFSAALWASPITWIVLAIVALIVIIVLIATKTDWFQKAWAWAWGGIKAAASAVWDWIKDTLWPGIKWVWDQLYSFIKKNIDGIVNIFQSIWHAILAVIGFFTKLREQAIGKMNELLDFVKSLPGRIGDALSSLGNLLFDKGKALVQGFINGIKAMFGSVKDVASNLVGMVTDFLPGSPAKKGPLSGKGWTPHRGKSLVEGLAAGMQGGLGQLEKLSLRVATVAAPVVPSAVGGAGLAPNTIPMRTPAVVPAGHAEASLTITSLTVNVRGVWDMNDPQASRKIATDVHEAIERVKREYK